MLFVYFRISILSLFCGLVLAIDQQNSTTEKKVVRISRRILEGHEAGDTRPYMVYLRPAPSADPDLMETNWLCGGAIIHERFVLTSAACIEDVQQFYIVSGTHRWMKNDNDCIKYGAKKAVWKCIPQDYHFDGEEFDNIRWMINDIGVVKVEDEFNFERRVKGCDFVPQMISYNNKSDSFELPNTKAFTAGWGSTRGYATILRQSGNSPELLETEVKIISTKDCKDAWPERYHYIIEDMICAKDSEGTNPCANEGVNCKELIHTEELALRARKAPKERKKKPMFRTRRTHFGGFCENDHGGPLVVGQGKSAIVTGIITASLTKENNQCAGPFLYTSVWKHRRLIACALGYTTSETCRMMLRRQHELDSNFNLTLNNKEEDVTLPTFSALKKTTVGKNKD